MGLTAQDGVMYSERAYLFMRHTAFITAGIALASPPAWGRQIRKLEAADLAVYKLKFMFDWGAGTCVWSANAAAREKYGYLIALHRLPISAGLLQTLLDLCARHDEALDWDAPSRPLLWNPEQRARFSQEARSGYERLRGELGTEYDIAFAEDALI